MKRRPRIVYTDSQKALMWDRFAWPRDDEALVTLTGKQLNWLLDGVDLWALRPHKRLAYSSVL